MDRNDDAGDGVCEGGGGEPPAACAGPFPFPFPFTFPFDALARTSSSVKDILAFLFARVDSELQKTYVRKSFCGATAVGTRTLAALRPLPGSAS